MRNALIVLYTFAVTSMLFAGCGGGTDAGASAPKPVSPTTAMTPSPPPETFTLEPISSSASAYTPTLEDWQLGILKLSGDGGFVIERAEELYPVYAATYIARACLDNMPLSSADFRRFATIVNITQTGHEMINDMLNLIDPTTNNLLDYDTDPPSCLRPFLYPETGQEGF